MVEKLEEYDWIILFLITLGAIDLIKKLGTSMSWNLKTHSIGYKIR